MKYNDHSSPGLHRLLARLPLLFLLISGGGLLTALHGMRAASEAREHYEETASRTYQEYEDASRGAGPGVGMGMLRAWESGDRDLREQRDRDVEAAGEVKQAGWIACGAGGLLALLFWLRKRERTIAGPAGVQ